MGEGGKKAQAFFYCRNSIRIVSDKFEQRRVLVLAVKSNGESKFRRDVHEDICGDRK